MGIHVWSNGLNGNIFTGKKKWTIKCGDCGHMWDEKVHLQKICSAVCPCCHRQQKWDSDEFFWHYENQLGGR